MLIFKESLFLAIANTSEVHFQECGKTYVIEVKAYYLLTPPQLPPLEFLDFLLYPRKFQAKQNFNPRNFLKLCYTLGNSTSFFLDQPMRKFHVAFNQPEGNFTSYFFNTPGSSISSTNPPHPDCFFFSGIAHWSLVLF